MTHVAPMPFSAPGEPSKLDMSTPRDNLRWALSALELAANGLRNSRKLGADDVEMLNLVAARNSVEEALRLIRSFNAPASETQPQLAHVWAVESKTTFALFASEDGARSYVSSFPPSVGGGMGIAKMVVLK